MHGEMLTYGLKRGTQNELLHIDKVHNGLGCDCVCPHCKQELIAKNLGTKKIPHFAHASGSEDCGKGRMTALHMLAQQVLEREKKIMLPKYEMPISSHSHEAQMIEYDRVDLEELQKDEVSTRRPDCICQKKDKNSALWVEIYCCHKVDEERAQDIKRRDVYCIEVDFSDLLTTNYTEKDVIDRLQKDTTHRIWINCPKWDQEYKRLYDQIRQMIKDREAERERLINICKNLNSRNSDANTINTIIYEIEQKAFKDKKFNLCIKDFLVPDDNWLFFVNNLPKNDMGMKLFNKLLVYYNRVNLGNDYNLKAIQSEINSMFVQKLQKEEQVYLEYLLVLWLLDKLTKFYNNKQNSDYLLNKVFTTDRSIKDSILDIIRDNGGIVKLSMKGIPNQIKQTLESTNKGQEILNILRLCIPSKPYVSQAAQHESLTEKKNPAQMTEDERIADCCRYFIDERWKEYL